MENARLVDQVDAIMLTKVVCLFEGKGPLKRRSLALNGDGVFCVGISEGARCLQRPNRWHAKQTTKPSTDGGNMLGHASLL